MGLYVQLTFNSTWGDPSVFHAIIIYRIIRKLTVQSNYLHFQLTRKTTALINSGDALHKPPTRTPPALPALRAVLLGFEYPIVCK